MKKFLSLVLALVMTMSLVTVSAGAKDFTDDSKITYKEAVDVMSAIGVIDGYADGSFNPNATLTRGAAAKIICNLILGPTTASALAANVAPFSDVPANSTFAGYIAYCQKEGIIGGYADGTFKPGNSLTGYAFMKMLLGALGYDANVEGYNAANYGVSVAKRAIGIGLDDGLVSALNGTRAVTREEACLYALNTLKATMVEYDAKTNVTVGGATVIIDGSKAKDVETNNDKKTIKNDGYIQFAEKYFTNLKLVSGARDDFARPANQWKLKAETIGTYAKTPDLTYSKSVKNGAIYADLGLGSTISAADVTVYEDGLELASKAVALKKGGDTKIGNTDNGVVTEVYYDDDVDTVEIITINTWVGQVNKTVKATSKKDAYIVVDTMSVKPASVGGTVDFETDEAFEDDAYVVFTYSQTAEEVKSVALATAVSGEATRAVNKETNEDVRKSVTIDGTVYNASAKIDGVAIGEVSVNNEYDVYLDTFGYMIYIEETEDLSGDYALVMNTQNKTDFNGNKALLLFADGTEKVVDTAKDYKTTGTTNYIPNGTIVTYKVDDGVYTLKPVKTTLANEVVTAAVGAFGTADTTFAMDNDKAGVTLTTGTMNAYAKNSSNVMAATSSSTKSVTTNSKTVFVVYDKEGDEYSVYTGIKNAPTINASASDVEVYTYCKSGVMSTVMFLFVKDSAAIEDDSNNTLFLAKESVSNLIHDKDGDYFEYNAYIGGELKTVKVDSSLGKALNGLYKTYSVDKYGVITKVAADDATGDITHGYADYTNGLAKEYYTGSKIDKTSADYTVTLGNKVITVADDAIIFAVDEDGKITESSYRAIAKDANDKFYAIVEDYLVKVLFIEEVEDVELSRDTSLKTFKVKGVDVVNGEVTVNNIEIASTTAKRLVVEPTNANAEVTKVEWKSASQTTWTTNCFDSTVYGVAGDDSTDSNWNNNLQIRVTVKAEDGSENQHVVSVKLAEDTYVEMTFSITGAIVKVNGTEYVDGGKLVAKEGSIVTMDIVFADGSTTKTVQYGSDNVPGYSGAYKFTVGTKTNITVSNA